MIGEDSEIHNDSKLSKCLVKQKVYLKKKSKLDDVIVSRKPFEFKEMLASEINKYFKQHNEGAYVMKNGLLDPEGEDGTNRITAVGLSDIDAEFSDDESERSSLSDAEDSYAASPEADDTACKCFLISLF